MANKKVMITITKNDLVKKYSDVVSKHIDNFMQFGIDKGVEVETLSKSCTTILLICTNICSDLIDELFS